MNPTEYATISVKFKNRSQIFCVGKSGSEAKSLRRATISDAVNEDEILWGWKCFSFCIRIQRKPKFISQEKLESMCHDP